MVVPGHLRAGAEAAGFVADSLVIGRDDDVLKGIGPWKHARKRVPAWFVIETGQRFSGEAGRCVPGRNNAQDFRWHTRSYHIGKACYNGRVRMRISAQWRGACCAMLHPEGERTRCRPDTYFILAAVVAAGVFRGHQGLRAQGLPAQNAAHDIGAAPQAAVPSSEPTLNSGDAPVNIVPRAAKPTEAPATPLPKANIRVDVNRVLVPVTVTDPLNRFVTGLEQDAFEIYGGQSQTDNRVVR